MRDMASAVLTRQAEARVERTGESFEEALKAVLETEAGQQLRELRDGPHRDKEAERWQEERPQKRSKERKGDCCRITLDICRVSRSADLFCGTTLSTSPRRIASSLSTRRPVYTKTFIFAGPYEHEIRF